MDGVLRIEDRQPLLNAPPRQCRLVNLNHSTRQRFVAIEFDYPPEELEQKIVRHESEVADEDAARLARLGGKIRNLREHGLQEGVSTRLLIYAGNLISAGVAPRLACQNCDRAGAHR
ncbi:MAG: CbbQ/NirQ/NorQ C-terminal domain-containing protein [Candidatus Binatia bacterium]